mmetsp:Transcript_10291/g.15794  ORF Transcript_10291/g.15794 Transcript_10291/m.15794 type:complete len:403 (-) Transcript_10291:255-1463(-)
MLRVLRIYFLLSFLAFISLGFTPQPGRASLHIKRIRTKSVTSLAAEKKNGKEKTLYDVLGGSMNDTHDQLREKYTNLARTLHPDAQIGKMQKFGNEAPPDFSEINAAWQVLGDPTARKRYDRKLKAKDIEEIAKGVGSLLEFGFRTAVPIFQKTADTTIAAADKTSKAMQDVSQKVGVAMDIFELDQESRGLEKRAQMELARAKKLKSDIENLPNRRIGALQDIKAKITSADANRFDRGFGVKLGPKLSNDIEELETIENKQQKQSQYCLRLKKETNLAEKQANDAKNREKLALQRLEDAKRELLEAKKDNDNSQKAMMDAQRTEKNSGLELEKIALMVQKASDKVKSGLVKKEDIFLSNESLALKKEIERAEKSARQLLVQSKELKEESTTRKRQEALKKT